MWIPQITVRGRSEPNYPTGSRQWLYRYNKHIFVLLINVPRPAEQIVKRHERIGKRAWEYLYKKKKNRLYWSTFFAPDVSMGL